MAEITRPLIPEVDPEAPLAPIGYVHTVRPFKHYMTGEMIQVQMTVVTRKQFNELVEAQPDEIDPDSFDGLTCIKAGTWSAGHPWSVCRTGNYGLDRTYEHAEGKPTGRDLLERHLIGLNARGVPWAFVHQTQIEA